MKVLHVYPINKEGEKPSSFRRSQINSLEKYVTSNSFFPVLKRKSIFHLIIYGVKLRKYIKKEKIDIVHCHWGTTLAFFGVLFSQVPFIVSFCGSDLLGNYTIGKKRTLKGRVSTLFSILASYLSSHIIVKSKELLEALPNVVKSKTDILPNGVDSSFFYKRDKVESRLKLDLPLDKKIIIFVNRPGAWVKNPDKARRIGSILESRNWGIFKEIANVKHDLIPYYFSAADFLLITSIHEGSCNVLKEALFCNLKIITTPTGDSKERLKGIPECFISNSDTDIVNFVLNSKDDEFITPQFALEPIELGSIAKKIIDIYSKYK